MNMQAASHNATAIEAAHWEPPMAPMEMPRQVLERSAIAQASGQPSGWMIRIASFLRIA